MSLTEKEEEKQEKKEKREGGKESFGERMKELRGKKKK